MTCRPYATEYWLASMTKGKGQKYKSKQIEPRGLQPKESRMMRSFWKNHSMDEAITWTAAELEAKLELYFSAYESRQIKLHPHWWYPEDPAHQVAKLRSKTPSKYKADKFN